MKTRERKTSMKIVPPGKKKCVWMEAGVVSYKLCDNNYDCSTCVYDHAMQAKVARQKEALMIEPVDVSSDKFTETWVEKMMKYPASQRKCRYMITGEVGRKLCPNAYECGNCSFDQMMQERLQAEPLPVHALSDASGFNLAEDTYYHEGHTWAKPEYGGRVRVGLDDFAQTLVGSLTDIQLPDVGHEVRQGEAGILLKRNGDRIPVLSPVDGVISRTNHKVLDNPKLINASPYEQGWLLIVEPTRLRKNLKGMFFGEEAHTYMAEEKEKLFDMATEGLRIAADGGASVGNILGELEEKRRGEFIKAFFKTQT